MLWLTFIHTFMGNRPKLADWSKLVCITPRSCLCSFPTSNWEVNADFSLNKFLIISQIVQLFVISSYIEGIETNLRIEKHTLRVFTWYFEQIVGKQLIRCFIYVFVSICCNSCHFSRFMLLNGTLWLTVTHAFMGKEPKLVDWSKRICITLQSCFFSLLTSNWEVSTGRSLNSFLIISEITKHIVIISFIEDSKTSLLIEKHTLRVLYNNLKNIFAKFGFDGSFM